MLDSSLLSLWPFLPLRMWFFLSLDVFNSSWPSFWPFHWASGCVYSDLLVCLNEADHEFKPFLLACAYSDFLLCLIQTDPLLLPFLPLSLCASWSPLTLDSHWSFHWTFLSLSLCAFPPLLIYQIHTDKHFHCFFPSGSLSSHFLVCQIQVDHYVGCTFCLSGGMSSYFLFCLIRLKLIITWPLLPLSVYVSSPVDLLDSSWWFLCLFLSLSMCVFMTIDMCIHTDHYLGAWCLSACWYSHLLICSIQADHCFGPCCLLGCMSPTTWLAWFKLTITSALSASQEVCSPLLCVLFKLTIKLALSAS